MIYERLVNGINKEISVEEVMSLVKFQIWMVVVVNVDLKSKKELGWMFGKGIYVKCLWL